MPKVGFLGPNFRICAPALGRIEPIEDEGGGAESCHRAMFGSLLVTCNFPARTCREIVVETAANQRSRGIAGDGTEPASANCARFPANFPVSGKRAVETGSPTTWLSSTDASAEVKRLPVAALKAP